VSSHASHVSGSLTDVFSFGAVLKKGDNHFSSIRSILILVRTTKLRSECFYAITVDRERWHGSDYNTIVRY